MNRQPPRCCECGRRVRRWHDYGGFGPFGFTPKTADTVWHTACMTKRATGQHTTWNATKAARKEGR